MNTISLADAAGELADMVAREEMSVARVIQAAGPDGTCVSAAGIQELKDQLDRRIEALSMALRGLTLLKQVEEGKIL